MVFLIGSACAALIFFVILLSPYPMLNNYIHDTNITAYDVNNYIHSDKEIELAAVKKKKLENKSVFSLPYSNSQLYALLRFKDKAEFVDFELVPDSDKNYISNLDLEKFNSENLKVFRYFSFDMNEVLKFRSESYIIVPVLSIKDSEGHDLDFYNQIFYISDTSLIGNQLLKLFDFKVDTTNSELDAEIFPSDQIIFKYDLARKSKFVLSQIARNLQSDYLKLIESSNKPEFLDREELVYKLILDTNYGDIVEITLTNKVENKELIAFTEKFLKSYKILVKFNKELKAKSKIEFELVLKKLK